MTATQVTTVAMDLTTTVRFPGVDSSSAAEIAVELDAALRHEISDQGAAAIKAYFVRPLGETVQVGLRFEGMIADHVESTADDVLRAALERIGSESNSSVRGKRTSTLLIGA